MDIIITHPDGERYVEYKWTDFVPIFFITMLVALCHLCMIFCAIWGPSLKNIPVLRLKDLFFCYMVFCRYCSFTLYNIHIAHTRTHMHTHIDKLNMTWRISTTRYLNGWDVSRLKRKKDGLGPFKISCLVLCFFLSCSGSSLFLPLLKLSILSSSGCSFFFPGLITILFPWNLSLNLICEICSSSLPLLSISLLSYFKYKFVENFVPTFSILTPFLFVTSSILFCSRFQSH